MSQLNNRRADQRLVAQYSSRKLIEHEAGQWISQGDADSFTEQLRDAATTRKGLISVLDLSGPHRLAVLLTVIGIMAVALVAAWALWQPETVTNMALFGLVAAGALGSVAILLGIRRLREVQRLDDVFPSLIEAEDVKEAAMICKTLGEQRGSNGAMFIATAAAIEGALAGFVVSAAFGTSVPAIIQLACAAGSAALLVLSTNLMADYFADRVRALRARYRIRRTKRIDFTRHPEKKVELAFLSRVLQPLVDDDHTRPTWKEWTQAFAALAIVGLLYALLVVLRLWGPPQNGMDTIVVIGFSVLCVLIAWIGCAFRGIGALLPDRQRVATMVRNRFPSVESFEAYKQQQSRSIERWANKIVRGARMAYVQRTDSGDDRWVDPNIQVHEPFANVQRPPDSAWPMPAERATVRSDSSEQSSVTSVANTTRSLTQFRWGKNGWSMS